MEWGRRCHSFLLSESLTGGCCGGVEGPGTEGGGGRGSQKRVKKARVGEEGLKEDLSPPGGSRRYSLTLLNGSRDERESRKKA